MSDSALVAVPEREVLTKTGKRIDLLLEGNDWVMVIENKIFHHQNNPFDDYMSFAQTGSRERFAGNKGVFVVLAPDNEPLPSGWQFVSYGNFITALKQQLAENIYYSDVEKAFQQQVVESLNAKPEARRKRLNNAAAKPKQLQVTSTVFVRNSDVVAETLIRANCICEGCKRPAPFLKKVMAYPIWKSTIKYGWRMVEITLWQIHWRFARIAPSAISLWLVR